MISPVMAVAAQLAGQKFHVQLEGTGLPLLCVSEAHLEIARFPDLVSQSANSIQYSQSNDAASALKISHSFALMSSQVRSAVP